MISIRGLVKSFGSTHVLRGLDLDIGTGETLAIIGQSGCGKSVLLKHVVGLLRPDAGTVTIDGADLGALDVKALYNLRQRFGFLFQGAALFDSMTVAENVALGLTETTRMPEDDIHRIVTEKLAMVGLPGIEHMKPSELSGGMKKRVGLARALATNPDYLLYDEPTTGLDPVMSNQIDALIDRITRTLKVTAIVVTHDMFSVYTIAHRVVLLHEGRVYFQGTPDELRASSDTVVRDFLARYA